jgi:hypothetical protein
VVCGLVLHRQKEILSNRIARASIAVAQRGETGQVPSGTQLYWLVKRGQEVGTSVEFGTRLETCITLGRCNSWCVEFFLSESDAKFLPGKTGVGA